MAAKNAAQRACSFNDERCWKGSQAAVGRERGWSVAATVGLAAGAVATATGVYLLLRPKKGPTTMARLVPTTQGGAFELVGTF